MAQRTVCLYNDKYIGIESIYTIRNGQKINIEGRIERLRKLGRDNQLFCPCGCGSNLILVAGDRNLREQHFRIKNGTENSRCTAVSEHRLGIESKILLKLWLDDNYPNCNIESRIPLSFLCARTSKHELSFYNFTNSVGVCYWYNRANITSEKIDAIESVENIRKVIYIADIQNVSENYQYPEYMKKIQDKQGYLLYLDIDDVDTDDFNYEQAHLYVNLIFKHVIDKTWHEVAVVSDKLSEFRLNSSGEIFYHDTQIDELVSKSKSDFLVRCEKQRQERKRLENEAKERERLRIESLSRLEQERELKKQREEEQRLLDEQNYKKEIEEIKSMDFSQQKQSIVDSRGHKWYRCKYCGKIGRASDFYTYGGKNSLNLGICYNEACMAKRRIEIDEIMSHTGQRKVEQKENCPWCGSKLVRRKGAYGDFFGCSGFPACRYNRSIT